MVYTYKTKGTCSREITVDVDANGVIQSCALQGWLPPATWTASPSSSSA